MPFFDFLDKASLGVEAAKAKLRQQLVATNPNLQFASQYKGKSDGSSARATKYTKAEVEKRIADLKRQQEELKHKKPRNPNSPPSSQEVLSDQNSKQNLKDIEKELAFLERYKGYAKALETGDNTKVLKYLRNLEEDKNGTRNYFFTAEYARMGLEIDHFEVNLTAAKFAHDAEQFFYRHSGCPAFFHLGFHSARNGHIKVSRGKIQPVAFRAQ